MMCPKPVLVSRQQANNTTKKCTVYQKATSVVSTSLRVECALLRTLLEALLKCHSTKFEHTIDDRQLFNLIDNERADDPPWLLQTIDDLVDELYIMNHKWVAITNRLTHPPPINLAKLLWHCAIY